MKTKTVYRFPTLAAMCMVMSGSASAATLYWDGTVSSANSTSNNSSTTTTAWLSGGNWDDGSTSGTRSFWTSGDTAIFGGTFSGTQTVTLSSQINLGGPTIIGGVGSSYLISLNGNLYNQLQTNPNIAPAITISAGSTLSADSASNNSSNLGTLTLNGGTLTSINGPTGPANDGGFGNWTIRNVITGGASLSTISSTTLYIAPGSFSFNVADAVAGSGTDLLVSSKIISGSLTKTGAGTMQLTGLNSYSGTTTVSQGTLLLNQTYAAYNTSAINGAVIVESGATLTMNNTPTGWGGGLTTLNVNGGTVNGSGGLGAFGVIYNLTGGTITGTARLDLGKYGSTLASINSLASGTTSVMSNTQGIMFRGDSGQTSYTITTAAGTTPSGVDLQIDGAISQNASASSLVKAGAGTLLLNGSSTYTGSTTVNAGKLSLGHATNTLPTTAVNVDGATAILSIGANSDTVGAVSLKNGGSITGSGGTLTGASYAVESGSVSAILGGAGIALTKSTAGTVTLTGVNSYTGATAVNAGTLIVGVGGVGSTASGSAVTVGASGTLGGTGNINGTLAVSGTLAPGNSGIGTLNAGATTWNSGSIWNFNLSSINNTSDKLAINGAFTKPGAGTYQFNFMSSTPVAWGTTYDLLTFTSTNFTQSDFSFTGLLGNYNNGTFAITGGNTLQFTAIPEPTSALAGLLLGAGLLRRRRSA